jgi:hypothetical protein
MTTETTLSKAEAAHGNQFELLELLRCAHCSGSGSCNSGKDGASCYVCTRKSNGKDTQVGLVCSVCDGQGYTEPKTDRIRKRMGPLLAMLLCYFMLFLVLRTIGKPDLDKILPFAGAIIGSITGFYFGARAPR